MLPARLMGDPLPDGAAAGMVIEKESLERMKDANYDFRGWHKVTEIPRPEKMIDLGLDNQIEDL
jgi:aldehyde:ferredoxin oxidoreductase